MLAWEFGHGFVVSAFGQNGIALFNVVQEVLLLFLRAAQRIGCLVLQVLECKRVVSILSFLILILVCLGSGLENAGFIKTVNCIEEGV